MFGVKPSTDQKLPKNPPQKEYLSILTKKKATLRRPNCFTKLVGNASWKADRRLSLKLNPVHSDFLIGSGYRSARAA